MKVKAQVINMELIQSKEIDKLPNIEMSDIKQPKQKNTSINHVKLQSKENFENFFTNFFIQKNQKENDQNLQPPKKKQKCTYLNTKLR